MFFSKWKGRTLLQEREVKFRFGTKIINMFLCLIILWPVDNEGLIISKLVLFTAEEQPNKSKCEFKFFKLLFKFIYSVFQHWNVQGVEFGCILPRGHLVLIWICSIHNITLLEITVWRCRTIELSQHSEPW